MGDQGKRPASGDASPPGDRGRGDCGRGEIGRGHALRVEPWRAALRAAEADARRRRRVRGALGVAGVSLAAVLIAGLWFGPQSGFGGGAAAFLAETPVPEGVTVVDVTWPMLTPNPEQSALAQIERAQSQSATLNASGGLAVGALGLGGVLEHGAMADGFAPQSERLIDTLVSHYDGRVVRLPGYVLPLSYDARGTTRFLLVPFVGACIHVPAPPPNQIVLVRTTEPYAFEGLFEPVVVTGEFARILTDPAAETALAEVGYEMRALVITRYED